MFVTNMKKVLVGTFYILQGIGNLIYSLYFRVETSYGAPGGGVTGLEIGIRIFLVFVSCLSLITAFILFLKYEDWALPLGIITCVFFIPFYGYLATSSVFFILFRHLEISSIIIVVGLFSLITIVLNVVSIFFLSKIAESKTV